MDKKDEKDIALAQDMIGVADLTNGGMHPVDPNISKLKELEEGSVICAYCSNCGGYPQYNKENFELLAGFAKIEIPPVLSQYYLKVNTCIYCDKKVTPEVSLEKIPI